MPPAEPIAERILVDVETTLRAMTAGDDYWTTFGTVTQGVISPLEQFRLPFASVLQVEETTQYRAGALERQMTFSVRIWIDDAVADAPRTLRRAMRDVQALLVVDTHRNGLAQLTREIGSAILYVVDQGRLCGGDVHFTVQYLTDFDDPSVGIL